MFGLAAVLVWRVGRRTVGEPAARIGAALFWIWPPFLVWWSTKARGFYGSGLVLGLAALLLVCAFASATRSETPRCSASCSG